MGCLRATRNEGRDQECLILMCGDNRVLVCRGHRRRKPGVNEYVDDLWHGTTVHGGRLELTGAIYTRGMLGGAISSRVSNGDGI